MKKFEKFVDIFSIYFVLFWFMSTIITAILWQYILPHLDNSNKLDKFNDWMVWSFCIFGISIGFISISNWIINIRTNWKKAKKRDEQPINHSDVNNLTYHTQFRALMDETYEELLKAKVEFKKTKSWSAGIDIEYWQTFYNLLLSYSKK